MTSKCNNSDVELRKALESHGFSPGPITDSTRNLYQRKLSTFNNNKKKTDGVSAADGAARSSSPSPSATPPVPSPPPKATSPATPPLSRASPPLVDSSTSQHTTDTVQPQATSAQDVVDRLLFSLDDPSHIATDTVLLFSDGGLLLVSRAVLVTQCPSMAPLLYNREEVFGVTVVTNTGQSCFFVRSNEYVTDLKEKITLSEGVSVARQRLFFNNAELLNSSTLQSCGVVPGVTIKLEVTAPLLSDNPHNSNKTVNPSLSVSHLTLKLGLERLVSPPPMTQCSPVPPQLAIPPQTTHIVHMYDTPSTGFRMVVKYLYSRQLSLPEDNCVTHLVVCCVLATYFNLPTLSEMCLASLKEDHLDANTVSFFVSYGEQIGCQALVTACREFMAK